MDNYNYPAGADNSDAPWNQIEEEYEQHTGLKDDYGTPIKDGDTIEWTYIEHGMMSKDKYGNEYFFGCITGGEMLTKEFKETKKIEYEVRGDIAGYFLDRPCGIGTTFISDKPKCRVVVKC